MAAKTFSDQIRQAISTSDKTRYQIWQETEIDQATLSRFMNGGGGLSMDVLDRLAECIGMRIALNKTKSKKGG
jgi:DNA transposition AAA+ family ATPase